MHVFANDNRLIANDKWGNPQFSIDESPDAPGSVFDKSLPLSMIGEDYKYNLLLAKYKDLLKIDRENSY